MNIFRSSHRAIEGLLFHSNRLCSSPTSVVSSSRGLKKASLEDDSMIESSGKTLQEVELSNMPTLPERPFAKYMSQHGHKMNHAKLEDRISALTASWNNLSEKEKFKYQEEYMKEKSDYYKRYKTFLKNLTKEELKRVSSSIEIERKELERKLAQQLRKKDQIKLGKPKRPPSAAITYTITMGSSGKITDGVKNWKELSPEHRQKFLDNQEEETEKYREQLQMWEKKMIEIGRSDLVRVNISKKIE